MPEQISTAEFLAWAAGLGVGFHPEYPGCLGLLPPRDSTRFWVLPADPAAWPHLIETVLDCVDDWNFGSVWWRSGTWVDQEDHPVRSVLWRGAGIPPGWAGAVRFSRDERPAVVAILYASLAFGWHSEDDIYFVPDHGRQVIKTDHHGVLHVTCADDARIGTFVEQMAAADYPLPTEPPDWTFKWPPWMGPRPPGAASG